MAAASISFEAIGPAWAQSVGYSLPANLPLPGAQEALYRFVVNGQSFARSLAVIEDVEGRLYVAEADLAALGLARLEGPSIVADGLRYFSLDQLAGVRSIIDRARLQVMLQVEPRFLAGISFELRHDGGPAPQAPPPGAFLNYSLLATQVEGQHGSWAGLFELAGFGRLGFGSTTFNRSGEQGAELLRLDSYLRRDDPARGLTLQLGDSVSSAPVWGRATRFAGLSWGTNVGVRPWLVTSPLQNVNGVAAVPSTLDIYVNRQLIESRPVPPGPFSVTGLPAVTGAGQITVVTRDALGREQVLSQNFYASRALLQPGYAEYEIDLGWVRENYGTKGADYGSPTLSAEWRGGVTNSVTVAGHLHRLQGVAIGGSEAVLGLGGIGVPATVSATAAASSAPDSRGWLVGYTLEHSNSRGIVTGAVEYRYASSGFRLPGDSLGLGTPRRQVVGNLGVSPGLGTSLSLTFLRSDLRARPETSDRVETLAASGLVQLPWRMTLVATWSRIYQPQRSSSLYFSLNIPLERDDKPLGFASASTYQRAGRGWLQTASYQSPFPPGPGIGVQALAQSDGAAQLGATWNTAALATTAEVARASSGSLGSRVGVSGALGMVESRPFVSRPLNDSFALVEVGDAPGVRVYRDNQWLATTDSRGRALVPSLAAYAENRIRVEPRDVPLDIRLGNTRATLVPYFRSPAVARFEARRETSVTFVAVRRLGDSRVPLPVGTALRADSQVHMVGYDGVVYLPSFTQPLRLQASVDGVGCAIELRLPEGARGLVDLGELMCE